MNPAFEDGGIRFDKPLVITSREISVKLRTKSCDAAILRINLEFHYHAAYFHPQVFLARKNRLLLKAGHVHHMDVSVVHVVRNVIVPLNQNVRLLAALESLHLLLAFVAARVGRAAARVLDFYNRGARCPSDSHGNVRLDVPDINQVLAVETLLGDGLNVGADVEPGREPTFMVVAGDVIGGDAFPRRVVLGKVARLPVNCGLENGLAVDSGNVAVNWVAGVKYNFNPLFLEKVILLMQLGQSLLLTAEVRVSHAAIADPVA